MGDIEKGRGRLLEIQAGNSYCTSQRYLWVGLLQELRSLFAAIEAAEGSVARVHMAARAASERLDALQKGYDQKHPEGIAKLGSWLGVR